MANKTDLSQAAPMQHEPLRDARQRAGLSLKDVAQELNIAERHLEALERGASTEELPKPFVNGYMRSYARYLGVDPQALSAEEQLPSDEADDITTPDRRYVVARRQSAPYQHRRNGSYYGLLLVIVMMAGLWWYQDQPASEPAISRMTAVEVATREGLVVERLDTPVATSEPLGLDEGRDETLPLAAVVTYDEHALTQTEEVVLSAGETGLAGHATDADSAELSFFFSDDCWIQITDGDGAIIYENVARSQASLLLQGKPPFQVVLGFAPAVTLSYNGEPVSIESGKRVARLILGST